MIRSPADKARQSFEPKRVARAARATLGAETVHAKLMLAWLADACHATETTARDTQSETDRAEGRRQVWLMVQDLLRITEADLRDVQDFVASQGG